MSVLALHLLTFSLGGVALLVGVSTLARWLRQPNESHPAQLATYESGEASVGNTWGKTNAHFYTVALVFMIFEIEIVLLWPWATVWSNTALHAASEGLWTRYALLSALLLIMLLAIGLLHVINQGLFKRHVPATFSATLVDAKVPYSYYEEINARYASRTTHQNKHP